MCDKKHEGPDSRLLELLDRLELLSITLGSDGSEERLREATENISDTKASIVELFNEASEKKEVVEKD